MFCVRPQTLTICVGQQQQFTAVGVDVENVEWSTSPAGDPATGSGGTFTTKWDEPGEKTVTASCEESSAQSDVTVVAVNKIQYYDPVAGWTDVPSPPSPFFVHKGTTVLFRAIKEPAGAAWPPGRPTWGGSSGASGTGETVRVTFNIVSSDGNDYKTVTATCGNTVTVNTVVFELEGLLTPDDNFDGCSQTRYGLAEKVDLDFSSSPAGIAALWMGGLQWRACGVGTVTNQDESGTADYDAGPVPGKVELTLEIHSGPSKGRGPVYERDVIAPEGEYMKRAPGTGIKHVHNTWSCGWKGESYLLPKDVSFANIERREAECCATATGWLAILHERCHQLGGWFGVGNGNIQDGCKVDAIDEVYSGEKAPPPDYAHGVFIWPIPRQHRVAGGNPTTHMIMNHIATSDDVGTCVMSKGGVSESRVPDDKTSDW